ncbi:hypothetical protein FWF48_02285 [Candidatus Saccharibacteria bacterium]|nr:hypothetical protein [Candidatus Saccharibacteria bacterium]
MLVITALMVAVLSVPLPALAAKSDDTIGMTLSPIKVQLVIEAGKDYESTFKVMNSGKTAFDFYVYAAPYQVSGEKYEPNFSKETKRTQISRWITFDEKNYNIKPGAEVEVTYHVKTPKSIPDGGQYAVIFAQTKEDQNSNTTGIVAAKRVGILVYAKAKGHTIEKGELKSNNISMWQTSTLKTEFKATNTGNTDFNATSSFVVTKLTGKEVYNSGDKPYAILPDTTRLATNEWDDVPYVGLFWATSKVTMLGKSYTTRRLVLVAPLFIPIVLILVIVAIIILIILKARSGRKYGRKVRKVSRR